MTTPAWNLSLASSLKLWIFGPGVMIILLIGALVLLLLNSGRKANLFLYLVFVTGFFYIYFSPLPGHWLGAPLLAEAKQLELEAIPPDCARALPTIVVLGGGLALPDEPSAAMASRLNEAARLLRSLSSQGQARQVVVSGGPTWPDSQATEAHAGVDYLRMMLGEAARAHTFWEEDRSLNTMQNASFTHALMLEHHIPFDIVLITGGYHLPRATMTFRHEGFRVCPHASAEMPSLHSLAFDNAIRTFMVLNEWIGRYAYQLRGWG